VCVVERKTQVWQCAVISGRRRDDIRVLLHPAWIFGTRIASAVAGAPGLEQLLTGLCLSQRRRGQHASCRGRGQYNPARNRIFSKTHDASSVAAAINSQINSILFPTKDARQRSNDSEV